MKRFCLTVLFVLIATYCHAQSISSVSSNTIANGDSITISGSSFGDNGPTIAVFDDLEKGTNNAIISTTTGSATVGEWDFVDAAPENPKYSSSYAHSGTMSFLSDQATSEMGRAAVANFSGTTRIYISYWVFLPTGSDVPGTQASLPNWKLADISGGVFPNYASNYTTAVTLVDLPTSGGAWEIQGPNPWHDADGLVESGYTTTTWRKNRWHRFENYYLGGSNNNGLLQMWETNSGNARTRTINTAGTTIHSQDTWTWFRLHAFAREELNGQCYYDDVYVATGTGAQARVEIGNQPTYANCTNLAICTVTSWSATSITATARTGSFPNGTAYLFVVDSSGNASSGYEVTIGSGGGDTTDPSVTISTTDPSNITSDSLAISGIASDAVWGTGSVCKWRVGSAPDGSNGTTITGLTYSGTLSWSATASGFSRGANTLYVGCVDAAGNWGSDSMVVNYLPVIQGVTGLGISFR